jgi:hypothetical protein
MTYYDTLWHYYTLLFFLLFFLLWYIYMTHGTIIFPIIFPIMALYLSFFCLLFSIMTGFQHPKNGNVQTALAILDPYTGEWLISVDDSEGCQLNWDDWKARLGIEKGKQPDAVFKDYSMHYFYYYAHYFYWLTRIPVSVITSYALQIYMHRFCLSQQAQATSGKLPLLSEAPKQFCFCAIILHYITIIAIIFSIICIIPKQKIAFSVGIHCR